MRKIQVKNFALGILIFSFFLSFSICNLIYIYFFQAPFVSLRTYIFIGCVLIGTIFLFFIISYFTKKLKITRKLSKKILMLTCFIGFILSVPITQVAINLFAKHFPLEVNNLFMNRRKLEIIALGPEESAGAGSKVEIKWIHNGLMELPKSFLDFEGNWEIGDTFYTDQGGKIEWEGWATEMSIVMVEQPSGGTVQIIYDGEVSQFDLGSDTVGTQYFVVETPPRYSAFLSTFLSFDILIFLLIWSYVLFIQIKFS